MNYHDAKTLRLFVTACELRSLSQAAERMNLAPSAASRRIQLLEKQANSPLLARRPHGVEPTAAGLTVLRYARDMLHMTEQLGGLLEEHRSGIRGFVRISASSSVLVQRLASDLSQFMKENPEIKLELEEHPTLGTLDALARKRVDMGAVVMGAEAHAFERFPFGGDRLVVAVPASHPLAELGRLRFERILAEEIVTLEPSTALRRLLTDRARDLGQHLKVRVQVSSFEVVGLMVAKGLGIGILPEHAVRPFAEALGLKVLVLDEPWACRDFAICVRSYDELDAPARRLITFLLGDAAKRGEVSKLSNPGPS
ncbi:LysR family transcriptional regulator [Enterovirga sp. DB1703]|uniref:LysR family transcriptional regulator n=2 Tax=Enterovirga aerilata TaxID=2730920 RepID=A0A849I6X0_9HYPH|nr:LysR family transcriptional regulator [Enterovirga sp. DB1703]